MRNFFKIRVKKMPTAERRKAIIQTVNQIKSKHTELNFVAFDIVKFLIFDSTYSRSRYIRYQSI